MGSASPLDSNQRLDVQSPQPILGEIGLADHLQLTGVFWEGEGGVFQRICFANLLPRF